MAIAMDSNGPFTNNDSFLNEGQDFAYIEYPTDPEDLRKMTEKGEKLHKEYIDKGLLSNKTMTMGTTSEFPKTIFKPLPSYIRLPNKLRNSLCHCGSGKKFKKCCIGRARVEEK